MTGLLSNRVTWFTVQQSYLVYCYQNNVVHVNLDNSSLLADDWGAEEDDDGDMEDDDEDDEESSGAEAKKKAKQALSDSVVKKAHLNLIFIGHVGKHIL